MTPHGVGPQSQQDLNLCWLPSGYASYNKPITTKQKVMCHNIVLRGPRHPCMSCLAAYGISTISWKENAANWQQTVVTHAANACLPNWQLATHQPCRDGTVTACSFTIQLLQLLVCPSTSAFKRTENCLPPSSMPLLAHGLFAAMLVKKGCDGSSRHSMLSQLTAVSCSAGTAAGRYRALPVCLFSISTGCNKLQT